MENRNKKKKTEVLREFRKSRNGDSSPKKIASFFLNTVEGRAKLSVSTKDTENVKESELSFSRKENKCYQ